MFTIQGQEWSYHVQNEFSLKKEPTKCDSSNCQQISTNYKLYVVSKSLR